MLGKLCSGLFKWYKVKFTLEEAMKAQRGSRGLAFTSVCLNGITKANYGNKIKLYL
jgi:hypothetical protein